MSQWAEIRYLHLTEKLPRKEIARRLDLDVKTVRRALVRSTAPVKRQSSSRGRRPDPHREKIVAWLTADPKITAKRIGKLLRPDLDKPVSTRSMREYVAEVRAALFKREAFVHRTHEPGDTLEVDFGESWVVLAGKKLKVKFFVAALPASNAYFAKAYRVERLETLQEGMLSAFRYFGGLPRRVVLDNTSLAVKDVLPGRERIEQRRFQAFRGELALAVDFCAPAKGNEKGSVEGGVRYVRNNCFRPLPEVASMDELNAMILRELEADLPVRPHPEGYTVEAALAAEKQALRPLPSRLPEACRVVSSVANKFGHVRVDGVTYSVPIAHAYRAVTIKLFATSVVVALNDEVIATHERSFTRGATVLLASHVLSLLERKHRAASESTAIKQWSLPSVFETLREALGGVTRKPDREWVQVLQLIEVHGEARVTAAVEQALDRGSPRLATIQQLLRCEVNDADGGEDSSCCCSSPTTAALPSERLRADLAAVCVTPPRLFAYDALTSTMPSAPAVCEEVA